jgi:hypothetical protein
VPSAVAPANEGMPGSSGLFMFGDSGAARQTGQEGLKNRRANVGRRLAPLIFRTAVQRVQIPAKKASGRVSSNANQTGGCVPFGSASLSHRLDHDVSLQGSVRRLAGADRNDYPAGPQGTGRPDRIRRFVARACPYVRGNPAGGVVTACSSLVTCAAGVGPGGGRRSPGRRAR